MSYIAPNLIAKKHCFFGAEGGVSSGKYTSLNTNFSSQDNPEKVKCNFEIIASHFGKRCSDMFTMRQGVSDVAVEATAPEWFKTVADGAVTTNPDILLGVKTADCAPVLLADYKHGVVGVAHAGWRGAYKGIVENVVALMVKNGAKKQDIAAAVGPCLQQLSFQVKEDMRRMVLNAAPGNERFFSPSLDDCCYYFDMAGFVANKLYLAGIENVVNSRIDTYPPENEYFSYRRATHQGTVLTARDYPTQYSFIHL